MLDNIRKYFLKGSPLLWNVRIILVLIFTILINLLFFVLGYLFIYPDFKSLYSYSSSSGFIYFASVIVSILSFIFWMISYSKNNAFKVFYPKSTISIYSEWLLIFIIVFTMVSYPLSFNKGIEYKTRSYVTKAEMVEAVEILNMIHILIPQDKTDYFREYPIEYDERVYNQTISSDSIEGVSLIPELNSSKSYDEKIIDAEKSIKIFEDYPDFAQLSLFNYNGYGEIYVSRYELDVDGIDKVKEWLANQDKEKILGLIDSYLDLQKKHNLTTNLTQEKWMDLIFNPTRYPVGDFNKIYRYDVTNPDFYYYRNYYENESDLAGSYYLQYRELGGAYYKIMNTYMERESEGLSLFFIICYSICIALMVFSFRVTSGKSWLIALVSIGVIFIIFLFVTLISESVNSGNFALYVFIVLTLILYIIELIYLLNKIYRNNANKRGTSVILNHLVWFIPVVPAMLIILVTMISKDGCDENNSCLYEWVEDHIWPIMWGNVCLVFFSIWFYIRFIILKWKGIPEE